MYALEFAGEDDRFAAREAKAAAATVEVVAPGLATARQLDPGRVRGLAFTRTAAELVARTGGDVAAARAALADATLDREGTVAVRARDVRGTAGVDTRAAERELGAALVDRGFEVDLDDPDHVLRAFFSREAAAGGDGDAGADDGVCLLGWQAVESVRDFAARAPTDKPFFQPGSMDPMLARALANVAGARPGRLVLDPTCGTGGGLVEAGLVGADVLGVDAQRKMVAGAAENLAHYLTDGVDGLPAAGEWHVVQGDATRLSLPDGSVDAAVFDVPYGRQSRIEGEAGGLVSGALAEARRVAPRAVVVADRSLADVAARAGWSVGDVFERRVHRSLVRYVHVLE